MKGTLRIISIGFVLIILAGAAPAQSQRFLPFQGRLTDSAGNPVSDGSYKIQFKIFDAPTGGATVWDGEIHTATVNGGVVSIVLGTKSPFSDSSIFGKTLYLDITLDVNADSIINESDPPMLPRQRIMPYMYVQDAGRLEGNQWSDFFTVPPGAPGDPDPAKNPTNSRAKNADLFDDIDSAAVFVDPANVTDPKVKRAAVADFVTSGARSLNYQVGTLTIEYSFMVCEGEGKVDLPGMTVNLTSHGRPVMVMISAKSDNYQISMGEASGRVYIKRDDQDIATLYCDYANYCTFNLSCMDYPPAGEHTYKVQAEAFGENFDDCIYINNSPAEGQEYEIIVFEL